MLTMLLGRNLFFSTLESIPEEKCPPANSPRSSPKVNTVANEVLNFRDVMVSLYSLVVKLIL